MKLYCSKIPSIALKCILLLGLSSSIAAQELSIVEIDGMIEDAMEPPAYPSLAEAFAAEPSPFGTTPDASPEPIDAPSSELPDGDAPSADLPPDDVPYSVVKEAFWHHPQERPSQNYIQADYLLWWAGDSKLPALITTNPSGTSAANVGTSSTTRILYGNETVGDWPHSGLRLRLGRFVNRSRISRVELDVWHLFQGSDQFSVASSAGSPILSRPVFNTQTGSNDAQIISYPGLNNGSFSSEYTRQAFGLDPSVFFCLRSSTCRWLELSTGYRYLWLQDELDLNERTIMEPGGLIAPGTGFDVHDQFTATNQFHLWTIGLSHSENHGNWLFNFRGNIGLGAGINDVDISGSTRSFVGTSVTSIDDAGFLALRTNRGEHRESQFAWVPELNVNAKYRVGKNVTTHVGYTLIWLPEAVQAANHVPTSIDPRNLPIEQPGAGPDPVFTFVKDDLLMHGFNFGLRYDF